jgi:hypothetical protein
MKNYTELFEELLDLTEFTLVKHKVDDEEYDPFRWSLIDRQGANLGDIMSFRFYNAEGIIDHLDIYINDYFYEDLENELDAYGVDLCGRELPWSAETWLALRNDEEFYEKNKRYCDEHKFEFDALDMIVNHADEIDLEKCYYEEEE